MRKRVCHVVRKFLPNTATFIGNQILNHNYYEPICLYTEEVTSNLGHIIKEKCFVKNILPTRLETSYYKLTKQITRKSVASCSELLKAQSVKIIHGHYGPDFWVFRNIIRKSKLPSIVSFYGYDSSGFEKEKFGFGKLVLKQVFELADICLAMSEDMKLDLLKLGCAVDKIKVHYFGSQLDDFLSLNKIHTDKIIFLTIASLVPKKGHIDILKAIKHLNDNAFLSSHKVEFRFIGSGPLEVDLKAFINENALGEYVKFYGKIDYKSVEYLNHLREADIFLHPSILDHLGNKEGIPTSITEAMAAGLPIISTFHAGIPSIVTNTVNGILLNENDDYGIANAISDLIKNKELRSKLSLNAREFARKNLNIKDAMIKLEDMYNYLIEKS